MTSFLRYLKLLTIVFAVIWGSAAQAAGPEQVDHLSVSAKLTAAGKLNVTETIVYNFGDTVPHTVQRRLPVAYHDDQGRTYRLHFVMGEAKVDGAVFTPQPKVSPDVATIELPLPLTPLPAGQPVTYVLNFELDTVVMNGELGDSFRYPVSGLNWLVPVAATSFELDAKGLGLNEVHCTTGAPGVTTAACTIDNTIDRAVVRTDTPLLAGEAMAVQMSFKRGAFKNYMQSSESGGWPAWIVWAAPAAIGLGGAMVVLALVRRWRRRYTGRKDEATPHRPHTS